MSKATRSRLFARAALAARAGRRVVARHTLRLAAVVRTAWRRSLQLRMVTITLVAASLLVALARKPRQVFTRELLLEQVWGYRHAADTRLVNVHVQRLRAKIERDPEKPEIVLTVRGVGYKAGPP